MHEYLKYSSDVAWGQGTIRKFIEMQLNLSNFALNFGQILHIASYAFYDNNIKCILCVNFQYFHHHIIARNSRMMPTTIAMYEYKNMHPC